MHAMQNYLILAMPLCFMLHNLEEVLLYHRLKKSYLLANKRFDDKNIFVYAVIFISLAVFVIAAAQYIFPSRRHFAMVLITFLALLINAIQHTATSLFAGKLYAGTITSLLLIMPLSISFIGAVAHEGTFTFQEWLLFIGISVIFTLVLIIVSVLFGTLIHALVVKFKTSSTIH